MNLNVTAITALPLDGYGRTITCFGIFLRTLRSPTYMLTFDQLGMYALDEVNTFELRRAPPGRGVDSTPRPQLLATCDKWKGRLT